MTDLEHQARLEQQTASWIAASVLVLWLLAVIYTVAHGDHGLLEPGTMAPIGD